MSIRFSCSGETSKKSLAFFLFHHCHLLYSVSRHWLRHCRNVATLSFVVLLRSLNTTNNDYFLHWNSDEKNQIKKNTQKKNQLFKPKFSYTTFVIVIHRYIARIFLNRAEKKNCYRCFYMETFSNFVVLLVWKI